MKNTLIMLCILCASFNGMAQDKDFDLSKYKFPDYKRHELQLYLSSNGTDYSHYYEFTRPSDNTISTYDNSNSTFNSNFNLIYRYEKFSRKYIDQVVSSYLGKFDYQKSDNSNGISRTYQPAMNFNLNASRKYYLQEDKLFLEGVTDFQFYFNSAKITYSGNDLNTETFRSNSFILSAGGAVGVGRIEKVNDLWQGYYILKKLSQQNSFNRELQENDIFEFSRCISRLKNKRFFDYRLRRIAELQSLDSLLHQQKLIESTDISYFTTLNDYWSFPSYYERKSGKELKFQILPSLESDYYKSNNNYTAAPFKTNLVSKIQFDCSKQMNLFWDRDLHLEANNSTLLTKNSDVFVEYPGNLFGTYASFGFGFYPDTRTRLKITGHYSGNESMFQYSESITKYWLNDFGLKLEASYYISPQLQISGNLNGNYYFSKYNSNHGHDIYYNLSLNYAIF